MYIIHRNRVEGANEIWEISVLLSVGYGSSFACCMMLLALSEVAEIQLGSEFCEKEPPLGRLE